MNLRLKVFLVVGSTFLLLMFVSFKFVSQILLKQFQIIEQKLLQENVQRVADAVQNQINDLGIKISDWGQWDDTYQYIQDRDPAYPESNLRFIVTEKSERGFTIFLNQAAPRDLQFSWVALAVHDSKTYRSQSKETEVISEPVEVPLPPTPEIVPLPEPIVPLPTETPVIPPVAPPLEETRTPPATSETL